MKIKYITLQQTSDDDNLYIVDQLVNCIEPIAGSVLTRAEACHLIARRDTKVTIKRAKS